MGVPAYIAVGSNVDAERNVAAALELLGRRVHIAAVSRFYRTPALGTPGRPDFLNGVVEIESELEPLELKRQILLQVEDELGRERGGDRNAPRTIDLDLVLYGDLVSDEPGLLLPSPEILERPFVALPLLELEPGLMLPGTGKPLRQLAAGLSSEQMQPAELFNARLRRVRRAGEESA